MTLIIVLKWVVGNSKGVVISSDSRATVGPVLISYETRKIL